MKQYIKEKGMYQYGRQEEYFHLIIKVLLLMIFYRILNEGILPVLAGEISFLELLLIILFMFACILLCYGGYYIGEHFIAPNQYREEECLIDGILLSLLLPVKTPVWLILIAAFCTIFIGRYFYDRIPIGMPVLIGILGVLGFSIWLQICHLETASISSIILEFIENYQLENVSVMDIWFGNVVNFISKTSPILCILSFFYLKKNIKWRIPVYFVGTYLLFFAFSNYFIFHPWIDILKWFGSGNILFLVIFCAADRRTTPVTNVGQILFAIFLGIFTYIGSFFFTSFISMILSIILCNVLTPLYDYFGNYYQLKFCNEFHHI